MRWGMIPRFHRAVSDKTAPSEDAWGLEVSVSSPLCPRSSRQSRHAGRSESCQYPTSPLSTLSEPVPSTSAAGMELIISSLCGFPGHGTHHLTRGNEVRVLVRNLLVSFEACRIGKLTLPNYIRVIRILGLSRTFAASQHATAGDAAFFQHVAS